jgi:hypothetical protein
MLQMHATNYHITMLTLPPPQNIKIKNIKLVGNERKGLQINFPRWRKPQAKLYLYIILPEQYYY